MTKQEADFIGSMNMCDEISNEAYKKIMCNCEVEDEPKRGKWVERYGEVPIYNAGGFTETKRIGWICSECKELEPRIARFCPNCGAKMDADMREVQDER